MIKFKQKETAHGFTLKSLWMMLCLLFVGTGSAWADDYVAQIGVQQYTDLTEAFYDAAAGETVYLLKDVDISVTSGSDQFCAEIPNGIIFDGQGHKVTVNRRGISVAPQSSNSRAFFAAKAAPSTYTFNVTIKNVTIENTAAQSRGYGGRCITTRGKLGSLTLDNVTLTTDGSAYNNTLSPLFIGGNQATAPTINIQNGSSIIADASAAKGNAIATINPIVLNVTGATLTAATAINFGEADESAGSNGSEVTIGTSTINSTAAAFQFYDNNIAVNIEASTINAGAGAVATFGTTSGNTVRLASAGNVVSYTTLTDAANSESFFVSKGTFNHVVPNDYLADGFDVTASLAGQETLTDALRLTSGGKMTIASGSISGEVVAEGGQLVFGTADTNDITVTGDQSLNLKTGNFVSDIAEKYLAEHFATNLINNIYVVKGTYQISNVAELQQLATLCNNSSTSGQTSGNTYELTADLDLSSIDNWTPIGGSGMGSYPSVAFKGTFDGKGHTISNLKCIDNTANYATAGLFGSVVGATIKNLTLSNINIESTHFAGAIVAYDADSYSSNGNSIRNCRVVGGTITSKPELTNGSWDNGNHVGGIIGHSQSGRITITDCYVEGVSLQAYRDLGGLAGYVSGGTVEGNTVKDVTLTQDNTNGYKTNTDGSLADMSSTVGMVVGGRSGSTVQTQANDATQNTANNVVITDPVVIAKIGNATFATLEAAVATATEGQTIEICKADTYTLPNLSANITVKGTVDGVIFSHNSSGNIAAVPNGATFENVTMKFGTNDYHGFQHSGEITMKDCTLNGKLFNYNNMVFDGCTFNAPGTEESGYSKKDYSMWVYGGNVTYTNCTFNSAGKVVNVFNDQQYTSPFVVTATNCTFNSTEANKAAFNVKATSGSTALLYEVTVEDCKTDTPEAWPQASESSSLVVLNPFVQVDDINPAVPSVTDITQITTDPGTGEKTEEVLYTTRVAEYNGTRYDTLKEALDAAKTDNEKDIVINLLNDGGQIEIQAWEAPQNTLTIGGAETETITINGNGHTLDFKHMNGDWDYVATTNTETKLILNNMNITGSGKDSGHWKRTNIFFHCAVEMNDVTSTAIGFENDAKLNNVTINDTRKDIYGIWIKTCGQNVEIDNLTINTAGNGGRGIAIKDEDSQKKDGTSLEISNATFTTDKKAAILVTSPYTVAIEANDLNIDNVNADSENAVWVDEKHVNQYSDVTLTGDATMIPEKGVDAYTVIRKTDKVEGYYTDLAKALSEAKANQTIELKADFELNETANTAETAVSIVANGHTITLKEGEKIYTVENTYGEVIVSPAAALTKIEAAPVNGVYCYSADIIYYAQIGAEQYRTLQAAVDAAYADMTGDVTITLLKDIEGYTVVLQKPNLNLTIDGQDNTLNGQLILHGNGNQSNTETLEIKNLNFIGDPRTAYNSGWDAFVYCPNLKSSLPASYNGGGDSHGYVHNLTIDNCTFTGNEEYNIVAVKTVSGSGPTNFTLKNCTATKLHSFGQFTAMTGLTIDNCKVSESGSFVNISGGTGDHTIANCTFTSNFSEDDKYAVRANSTSSANITLEDNTFTAPYVIVLGKGTAATAATFNVVSGTYVGDIQKTASATGSVAISGGHFNANLTDAAYADFIADEYVAINDETEVAPYTVQHAIAKRVVSEKNVYYLTVNDAVTAAGNGDVITLLTSAAEEGTINGADVAVASGKNVTFDLNGVNYAAENITVTGAATITNGTVTAAITNSGELTVTGATDVNGNITSTGTTTFDSNYAGTFTGALTATAGTVSIADGTFNMSFDGLDAACYSISGGKFSSIVPYVFCAEGYTCNTTADADNLYEVIVGTNVAAIDGIGYTTLQAAVDAAEDGNVIDLLGDLTLTTVTTSPNEKYNVNVNKSVTIDGHDYTITSSNGKRALVLTGEGNNITLKNMTVENTHADWTVGIVNALTANLDNVTIDGSNYSGSYNQPLTIGGISDNGRVTLNVTNSTIKTNDEGSAHYAIIVWHTADITVENSTLKGWANVYLKPDAEGSIVNISNTHMISKGASGATNDFALISLECGKNTITLTDNTAAISTPVEGTYNTLFNFSQYWAAQSGTTCNNNVVKLLGNTTFDGGDTKYGGFVKDTELEEAIGEGTNNSIYFDATTKSNFERFFTIETAGRTISNEPVVLDNETLYTLNFSAVAKLYSADGSQYKYFTTLKGALEDDLFEAGSQIDLLANVTIDEDITVNLNAGEEFAIDCDDYTLQAGTGHILLPTDVKGSATKATDVFAQVESRDDVVAGTSAISSSYYTNCYVAMHHEVAYTAGGSTTYKYFEEAFEPAADATITLQKDITLVQNVSAAHSFTLNFDSNTLTRGEYAITLSNGVTVTTDEEVNDFDALFITEDPTSMVVEAQNGNTYTYTVVSKESEGIYELADGVAFPYNLTSDVLADKVTYTRSYDENRVDKYQGWMLPFDYTITAEDLENFSFFKISMVAHSNVAGESASTEDIWIHVNPMSAGEVLRANKPYIYKPKTAIDNYEFISENVTLKKPMETMLLQTATTEATYSFYGTYQTTTLTPSNDHRDFYLSINGDLSYPSTGNIAVGAYRWYLRMETKNDLEYARGIGFVVDEDNTTTGLRNISTAEDGDIFYTLDGVRVEKPGKGIFIKKSVDGKTQKVSFK